jgi:hypothetical protein
MEGTGFSFRWFHTLQWKQRGRFPNRFHL